MVFCCNILRVYIEIIFKVIGKRFKCRLIVLILKYKRVFHRNVQRHYDVGAFIPRSLSSKIVSLLRTIRQPARSNAGHSHAFVTSFFWIKNTKIISRGVINRFRNIRVITPPMPRKVSRPLRITRRQVPAGYRPLGNHQCFADILGHYWSLGIRPGARPGGCSGLLMSLRS